MIFSHEVGYENERAMTENPDTAPRPCDCGKTFHPEDTDGRACDECYAKAAEYLIELALIDFDMESGKRQETRIYWDELVNHRHLTPELVKEYVLHPYVESVVVTADGYYVIYWKPQEKPYQEWDR